MGPLKNSFESNVAKLGGTMCAKDTVVVSQNAGILLVLLRGGSQTFSNRLVESFETRSGVQTYHSTGENGNEREKKRGIAFDFVRREEIKHVAVPRVCINNYW